MERCQSDLRSSALLQPSDKDSVWQANDGDVEFIALSPTSRDRCARTDMSRRFYGTPSTGRLFIMCVGRARSLPSISPPSVSFNRRHRRMLRSEAVCLASYGRRELRDRDGDFAGNRAGLRWNDGELAMKSGIISCLLRSTHLR